MQEGDEQLRPHADRLALVAVVVVAAAEEGAGGRRLQVGRGFAGGAERLVREEEEGEPPRLAARAERRRRPRGERVAARRRRRRLLAAALGGVPAAAGLRVTSSRRCAGAPSVRPSRLTPRGASPARRAASAACCCAPAFTSSAGRSFETSVANVRARVASASTVERHCAASLPTPASLAQHWPHSAATIALRVSCRRERRARRLDELEQPAEHAAARPPLLRRLDLGRVARTFHELREDVHRVEQQLELGARRRRRRPAWRRARRRRLRRGCARRPSTTRPSPAREDIRAAGSAAWWLSRWAICARASLSAVVSSSYSEVGTRRRRARRRLPSLDVASDSQTSLARGGRTTRRSSA